MLGLQDFREIVTNSFFLTSRFSGDATKRYVSVSTFLRNEKVWVFFDFKIFRR